MCRLYYRTSRPKRVMELDRQTCVRLPSTESNYVSTDSTQVGYILTSSTNKNLFDITRFDRLNQKKKSARFRTYLQPQQPGSWIHPFRGAPDHHASGTNVSLYGQRHGTGRRPGRGRKEIGTAAVFLPNSGMFPALDPCELILAGDVETNPAPACDSCRRTLRSDITPLVCHEQGCSAVCHKQLSCSGLRRGSTDSWSSLAHEGRKSRPEPKDAGKTGAPGVPEERERDSVQ